jgi:hypothetical protein
MPRPAPTYSLLPAPLAAVVFADPAVPVEVAVDVKEVEVEVSDKRRLVLEAVALDTLAVPVGAEVEAQEAAVGTVTATARQMLLAYAIVSTEMVSLSYSRRDSQLGDNWLLMSSAEQAPETQQDNLEM